MGASKQRPTPFFIRMRVRDITMEIDIFFSTILRKLHAGAGLCFYVHEDGNY